MVVLLSRALFEYRDAVHQRLSERGFEDVPPSGSRMLARLADAPATVGELALSMRSAKQGTSRLSDALVERGYLRRNTDPVDHRLVRLSLTARGRSAAEVVSEAVAEVNRSVERRMGKSEASSTRRALLAAFGGDDQA